jgi:hypothetical protein
LRRFKVDLAPAYPQKKMRLARERIRFLTLENLSKQEAPVLRTRQQGSLGLSFTLPAFVLMVTDGGFRSTINVAQSGLRALETRKGGENMKVTTKVKAGGIPNV